MIKLEDILQFMPLLVFPIVVFNAWQILYLARCYKKLIDRLPPPDGPTPFIGERKSA